MAVDQSKFPKRLSLERESFPSSRQCEVVFLLRRVSDTSHDMAGLRRQCKVAFSSCRSPDTSQGAIASSRQCTGAELSHRASDTSQLVRDQASSARLQNCCVGPPTPRVRMF